MKRFVVDHFESLINRGDLSVIERNVRHDYVDHNGLGAEPGERLRLDESRKRAASGLKRFKNLKVEIRDVLADGDKVVVRNVWTADDGEKAAKVEMHGFVLFRLEGGRLAERWATVTDPAPLRADRFDW